jgi:uncharacterized membrane protein
VEFLVLKWLHILGATLIFGTGIGTAFHFWFALRGRNVPAIAAAAHATVIADFVFTLPAVLAQPVTGALLAFRAGYPLGTRWIVWAIALYLAAGACWVPVVFIQVRLRRLAREAVASGEPLPSQFHRLARWWLGLGWPAFFALAAIFWLMVARPA